MAGGGIARAVRGLFWTIALLLAVLWYIPLDLPQPPPPRASSPFGLPSRCVPTLCHCQMPFLLRHYLFLTILICISFTFSVKAEAGMLEAGNDDLPNLGGARTKKATSTMLVRAMLLLAVASSAAGAALSAAALVILLEVKLGVVLACMSTPFQGAIYSALVLFAGAVCYSCVRLVTFAMSA